MNDLARVATEAITDRKQDWADYNAILGTAALTSQTKDTAAMVAQSQDGHVRYQVTLRKYSWLLQPAHDDWRWVIWIPNKVERIACPPVR